MKMSVLLELAKREGNPVIINMSTDTAARQFLEESGMKNIPPMLYIYKNPIEWTIQPKAVR